jgi:xanthine dehydrogenase YagR molybdenum-binding subunit
MRPWSHVILAAMAARELGRSVKVVLSRKQMFGPVGARPYTVQTLSLGARRDGTITAIKQDVMSSTPTFNRGSGESSGTFALESAIDELAYAIEIDPLEIRLRNYADIRRRGARRNWRVLRRWRVRRRTRAQCEKPPEAR